MRAPIARAASTAWRSSCVSPLLLIAITTSPAHDLTRAAVDRLGGVQEGGGRAGRGEQRRRVVRHVLGLADARHVHAPAARLGAAHQRERAVEALRVDALAQPRELLDRDVEHAERLRRVRRDRMRRRPRSPRRCAQQRQRRTLVELEHARARRRGVVGEGAEPLDAGGAARVGEPTRVLPAESVVQRGEQAAEEGVARAGRVDAP